MKREIIECRRQKSNRNACGCKFSPLAHTTKSKHGEYRLKSVEPVFSNDCCCVTVSHPREKRDAIASSRDHFCGFVSMKNECRSDSVLALTSYSTRRMA